ncbi:hypothetical protein LCGC14_2804780 [marine sediment metagenome]|uniref:Uncharacterized protein n=1 Tax=marine sediment metagenome TaxID=412755 RepID=A0A0F8YLN7_9ZZZZ
MLSKQEKQQIRVLLQDPRWKTAERLAELLINNLKENSNMRDTEWETLKATILEEGQIQGIRNLIKELYLNAQAD